MGEMMNRRTFLFYGGAAIAGVTLGELGRRQLARLDVSDAQWRGPGTVTWATSVCRECAAGCGVRARLVDGVLVSLQGNPLCPIGHGRLCAKGHAAIEGYFDPDRLVGPVKRAGKRGENRWEKIEWPAAVALLSSTVQRLSANHEAMLALGSEEQGPVASVWERFWQAAGARVAWAPAPTAARLRSSLSAMTAVAGDPLFDYQNASYLLSFGAPLVEEWLSPVWAQRSYGSFRYQDWRARGRLVQVDDRCSMTARKADEWLAVSAERQVFLAYSIASVLLREGRVNRAFLEQAGGNVADFERELHPYSSRDVISAASGVPAVTVMRLARELVTTPQPLVAVASDAPSVLVNAAMALNALIGAFDRPGGISAPQEAPAFPLVADSATALQDVVVGRFQPRLVAFRDAGVLRGLSSPPKLGSALNEAALVVSFSPYLDETAAIADLVMPVHTPLESWHAVVPASAIPVEMVAFARPAVQPRLQTRDVVTILSETAAAVGGTVADACAACGSSEDLVTAEVERLWNLSRGVPYSSYAETVTRLQGDATAVQPISSREQLGPAVLDSGGWADAYVDPGRIKESLKKQGGLKFALPHSAPPTTPPVVTLSEETHSADAPAGASAHSADTGLSLRLVPFVPAVISKTGSPNQPGVLELLGPPDTTPWRVWAEMHPLVAEVVGVTDGSTVRIASQHGDVRAVARIVPDMPRDAVAVACVPALGNGGRWTQLVDADARRLLGPDGTTAPGALRVSLGRAD